MCHSDESFGKNRESSLGGEAKQCLKGSKVDLVEGREGQMPPLHEGLVALLFKHRLDKLEQISNYMQKQSP